MGGYNSAGVSAIPEPSTWLLMMASGLVATARPRRTGQQGSGEGLVKLIELAISKTAGEVKRPDMGVPPTGTKPDEAPGESSSPGTYRSATPRATQGSSSTARR